jgi:hypothetical protein
MSVINRRNALLGWAAWTVAKQVAKQKARKRVGADDGGARRIVVPAAAAAAAATILGAVFFWRRHSRPAELGEVAQ